MEVKQKMNKWTQLTLSVIALIIFIILLTGCAEFPINAQQGEIINQLNCEPAESNGCAGWLSPE